MKRIKKENKELEILSPRNAFLGVRTNVTKLRVKVN